MMAWGVRPTASADMHHYSAYALNQCVGGFLLLVFWTKKVTEALAPLMLAVAVCSPRSTSKLAEVPVTVLEAPSRVKLTLSPERSAGETLALIVTEDTFHRVSWS